MGDGSIIMGYWFDGATSTGDMKEIEMAELIAMYPHYEEVIRKAYEFKGRSHSCKGDATRISVTDLISAPFTSCRDHSVAKISVAYQSKIGDCVPFAPLNLLLADYPTSLKERLSGALLSKVQGRLCDFNDVSTIFQDFGVELRHLRLKGSVPKDKMVDWLLAQREGLFAVSTDCHCIGVDCNRRLIFDCAESFALSMTITYFRKCLKDFVYAIKECRRVVIDHHKINKVMRQNSTV
jgi:hypothetical protein